MPFSAAHRIAFVVPFAEMLGVAPGKANAFGVWLVGVADSAAFEIVKALMVSPTEPKYTVLLKYAGAPNIGPRIWPTSS
ncbi:hypothetical protein AWB78_08639 [Caballeronia calidae]|uniref:Uncharacterized protein n=1 Tax=Caballeronia calidae TaxID=1777139 RepID=A0A158EL36_9BURK|nr:hypothetical protein AWB78_08639 [Caballeronia calidae]